MQNISLWILHLLWLALFGKILCKGIIAGHVVGIFGSGSCQLQMMQIVELCGDSIAFFFAYFLKIIDEGRINPEPLVALFFFLVLCGVEIFDQLSGGSTLTCEINVKTQEPKQRDPHQNRNNRYDGNCDPWADILARSNHPIHLQVYKEQNYADNCKEQERHEKPIIPHPDTVINKCAVMIKNHHAVPTRRTMESSFWSVYFAG